MQKLVDDGRVHSIGVSNFNSEQIDRILSTATIKPVTNQVECHPNLNQRKLIEFCSARNITVTAYSPLGRPHTSSGAKLALSSSTVFELAQKYHKTPAQIILRYTVCAIGELNFVEIFINLFIIFLISDSKWCHCHTKEHQSKTYTREYRHFRL